MGAVRTIGRRSGWAWWPALVGVALLLAACGTDSGGAPYEATREVVSHETTQEILVFAPDAEGSWPVVFAVHGINGAGDHMAEIARRLAERGFVVFAPTYRTDFSTQETAMDASLDLVCAGWYAGSIAGDHGGDLDQPITFLGWSLGAGYVLEGGLVEDIDPAGDLLPCSVEAVRADVVVTVAGCHYGPDGTQPPFDPTDWTNRDATIVMTVGADDTQCEPWQTEDAAALLRSHGYDVDVVVFEDADHFSPLFLEFVDGGLVADTEHPAGDQLVDLVVDAVDARTETP